MRLVILNHYCSGCKDPRIGQVYTLFIPASKRVVSLLFPPHSYHCSTLTGLLTTVALTALITDAVKIGIGRPRPHFYARCFGSTTANAVSRSYSSDTCSVTDTGTSEVGDSREFDCRLMMQSGTSFAWQLQTSWKKRTRASLVGIPHVSTVATDWACILTLQFSNECKEWLFVALQGRLLDWVTWRCTWLARSVSLITEVTRGSCSRWSCQSSALPSSPSLALMITGITGPMCALELQSVSH